MYIYDSMLSLSLACECLQCGRSVNYLMVKCGLFVTYHLGTILAIIQMAPIKNGTRLLGMADLYANHFTVRIGKEEASNFPVA